MSKPLKGMAFTDMAADNVRLRAELAEAERTNHLLMRNAAENWRDKAAIARVRELCERSEADGYVSFYPGDVLRALDGGTE